MKRFFKIAAFLLGVVVTAAIGGSVAIWAAPNVSCYFAQGGASFNATSGCTINVDTGASLIIDSGATFTSAAASLVLADGSIERADLAEDSLAKYHILFATLLENGGVAGVVGNSDGEDSNDHYITETAGVYKLFGNSPNSDTQTDTSIFQFILPQEYVDAATVVVRINALYTTVGDTQTLDLICYEAAEAGTVGADINSTTIKTLTATATNFEFTITPTGLVSGDRLSCEFVTVFQDSNGTVGEAQINSIQVLVDIKG